MVQVMPVIDISLLAVSTHQCRAVWVFREEITWLLATLLPDLALWGSGLSSSFWSPPKKILLKLGSRLPCFPTPLEEGFCLGWGPQTISRLGGGPEPLKKFVPSPPLVP